MARIGDDWDGSPDPLSWLGQNATDHRGESSPWQLVEGQGPPLERDIDKPEPVPDVFHAAFPEPAALVPISSSTAPRIDLPADPEEERWTEIRAATHRWTGEFTPIAGMRAWLATIRQSLEHDR